MKQVTISRDDAGQRLDKFLIKYLKTMPQSLIYKALRKKRVKVNGKRRSGEYRLSEGDRLELYINDEFFEDTAPDMAFLRIRTPRLSVIYEDENLLAVDKPQGMVVHADSSGTIDTLIANIQSYLYQKGEYRPEEAHTFSPALAHRIDRNTRGLVLAAKNAEALRVLSEKIRTKEIRKFYQCIVCGHPPRQEDILTGYLVKDEKKNQVTVTDMPVPGAKTIVTKYRVLKTFSSHTLLEVELVTGRTHQIRAHMAHIGCPLLGDGKYGVLGKSPLLRQQALCAWRLRFDFRTPAGCLNYLKGKEIALREPELCRGLSL